MIPWPPLWDDEYDPEAAADARAALAASWTPGDDEVDDDE